MIIMVAKNKNTFKLTPRLQAIAPRLVIYEIQAFYYALKTWNMKLNYSQPWLRVALNNASLDTTLVHTRILLDFFEVDNVSRYKDDVLSMDMGFPAKKIMGSKGLKKMIHKRLSHLTYTRSKFIDSDKKYWDMKVFRPLVRRCEKFLIAKIPNDLIEKHAKPDEQEVWDKLKRDLMKFMT